MGIYKSLSFAGIFSLVLVKSGVGAFVEPELNLKLKMNAVDAPATVSSLIHLPGQFNLSEFSNPPELKRNALVKRLRDFHAEKSEPIIRFLKSQPPGSVREITSIWITNSLRVEASPEVIEKLTKMNTVEGLFLNAPKKMEEFIASPPFSQTPIRDSETIVWGVKKIRADEVWARGHRGQGITVAIIDSGANFTHPDLAPNIWSNAGELGRLSDGTDRANNGIDDDGNGFIDDVQGWNFEDRNNDIKDLAGHGSQAAGIVAGMGTGGKRTGVAPGAKLMILKACCNAGSTEIFESNIWEAYQYALQEGAQVISMSLSAKHNSSPTYNKWRRAGEVLLVAGVTHINSAGNRGSGHVPFNMGAPASNPPAWLHPSQPNEGGMTAMLTVGATDETDSHRQFSSTGPVTWESVDGYKDYVYSGGAKQGLLKPDICGPSEVSSTSMNGNGYTPSFGGTSSATPHVAGVVALLLSFKPHLTAARITEALQMTALPVNSGFTNTCGAGRVDALAAFEYVATKF